jgi:hypothetical protein
MNWFLCVKRDDMRLCDYFGVYLLFLDGFRCKEHLKEDKRKNKTDFE